MSPDVRHWLTGIRFKKEHVRQMLTIGEHRAWSNIDLAQGKCLAFGIRMELLGVIQKAKKMMKDEYGTDEAEEDIENEGIKRNIENGE